MAGSPLLILGWTLGDVLFGTEVSNVVHIEEDLAIRTVPRPAPGVIGLTHYQDSVLPVIDLAHVLLGEVREQRRTAKKHVIFQSNTRYLAGLVDSVVRMHPATTEDLTVWAEPPDHPAARFVRAVLPTTDRPLWLVDVRRIVRDSIHRVDNLRRGV